jgi:transcriptional regulator with XRE-family HTH domain
MDEIIIGKKIHHIRLQNRLTLQEIAQRTEFTKGYLSLIEQGKKSPPIASLSKIAKALDVDIAAFFERKKAKDRITLVRKGERKVVVRDEKVFGYRYESIASAKRPKRMEPFVVTHLPESKETSWFDHEGEELFYVLEGKINFFYGDETYLLCEGDCIYLDPSIQHRGVAVGKKPAKALVVIYSSE